MAAPTIYVILRAASAATDDNPNADWREFGKLEATSAEAAIRYGVGALADDVKAGTYVAVPARSWKPVRVTTVQTTNLKLEHGRP